MTAPTRPIIRWHGGKWRLAPWIISQFPPHDVYCEPFGGGASVLLRKAPVAAEVYNDLDGRIVNLFRVLRDEAKAAALHRRIYLTPFARAEFEWSCETPVDDIDDAHKMIVLSFMGFGTDSVTRTSRTGFRAALSDGRVFPSREWSTLQDRFAPIVQRLRGVLIEHCEAHDIIDRVDGPRTLFYVDPPYLPETRSSIAFGKASVHGYRHELTRDQHAALLDHLRELAGMVVLSGYPDPLYDDLLCDWTRLERQALAFGARPRTEVVWINPAAARHGKRSLFDHASSEVISASV